MITTYSIAMLSCRPTSRPNTRKPLDSLIFDIFFLPPIFLLSNFLYFPVSVLMSQNPNRTVFIASYRLS